LEHCALLTLPTRDVFGKSNRRSAFRPIKTPGAKVALEHTVQHISLLFAFFSGFLSVSPRRLAATPYFPMVWHSFAKLRRHGDKRLPDIFVFYSTSSMMFPESVVRRRCAWPELMANTSSDSRTLITADQH
jgi:hypothetical protein